MNKIYVILLIALVSNCISFRSGEFKGVEKVNFNTPKKPAIKINLTYEYKVDDSKQPALNQAIVDNWAKHGEDTLKEIPNVTPTKEDLLADYFFDVKVTESTDSLSTTVSPFIAGLTLMVLPSYTSAENQLETSVRNKKGVILGKVVKKEKITFIGQILLLFALPFTSPIQNVHDQKADLFRATYKEIHENNILTGSKK
ncbi:hypothetical protein [Leptospira meyeri]|uniref:hypothetical protein n=1 Tax=Leptospira meyeri TaxID=29508 RepID=UPI000C2B23FA|nr:hypothetical protein [Leptospira meyeri]PKA22815.1 hypothetical protein CH381_28935 [Leptospira sp. mixed culture ATI2-C-A1]TGL12264.1 hypothetical protein EHQ50_10615 [Leptospira meyeri]